MSTLSPPKARYGICAICGKRRLLREMDWSKFTGARYCSLRHKCQASKAPRG